MAAASDHYVARLVFQSASVLIADPARKINSYPWRYIHVQIVQFGVAGDPPRTPRDLSIYCVA